MAHLKKSAATGHLLKNSDGHLVKSCESNTCHGCDPPIPDTLTLTCSNFQGDFAVFNGVRALPWRYGCYWATEEDLYPEFIVLWTDGPWLLALHTEQGACLINLSGPDTPCDPRGTYNTVDWCWDEGCTDADSCEDSQAAGCQGVVTYP